MEGRRLRTERLEGRPFTPGDWPIVYALHSDPRTAPWLLAPGVEASEERARRAAAAFAESWRSHGFGPYALRRRARLIGYAGLRASRLEGLDELEALWGVLPDLQGQGLATEAAAAAIEADGAGPSVAAWTLPANAASLRVMEKLGFGYERDAIWAGLPHVVWRLPLGGGAAA